MCNYNNNSRKCDGRYSLNIPNIEEAGYVEFDSKLTEAQQQYFKDSKVIDENGDLLPVYHGTNRDFNVIDLLMVEDVLIKEAFDSTGTKIIDEGVAVSFNIFVPQDKAEAVNKALSLGDIQLYNAK